MSSAMLALSSLSQQQPLRRRFCMPRLIFFSQAIYGVALRGDARHALSWLSVPAESAADRRRDLPARAAITTCRWPRLLWSSLLIVAVSGVILERRVRGVEVWRERSSPPTTCRSGTAR